MTSHMSSAKAGVKKAMKHNNMGGARMVRLAKLHASKKYKGSGNAMLKAAAMELVNHPNSKKAQKMVKHAVKTA